MASIQQIKKRFLDLQGREMEFVGQALQMNEGPALDLVREQLAQGIKADGNPVDFTYAELTVELKSGLPGLAGVTDHLTNYDTGESYRNMYMKVEGVQVEWGTTTDKEGSIEARMNEERSFMLSDVQDGQAFRPSPKSKEELIRLHVQPDFNVLVRESLKL